MIYPNIGGQFAFSIPDNYAKHHNLSFSVTSTACIEAVRGRVHGNERLYFYHPKSKILNILNTLARRKINPQLNRNP